MFQQCFEAFISKYLLFKSQFFPINAGVVCCLSSKGSLLAYLRLPVSKATKMQILQWELLSRKYIASFHILF